MSSSLTIPNWGDPYHFHAPDLTDVKAPIIKMLNTEQKFINLVALLDFGSGEFEIGTRNNITWSSSNRRIADVDSSGVVTFYQSGTVTITARTTDGSNLSRSATVTAQYQVEKITIFSPNDSHVLGAGRSMQLTAKVEPQTATNARLRWYIDPVMSTRLSAATINESNGRVTAAEVTREEHITVVAEATDVDVRNQNIARGTFEITIFPLVKSMDIYCNDEIVSKTTVYADVTNDSTLQLYPVAYPVNLASQDVTWSSSNTRVADVDKNGLVAIKGVQGSTVIRAVAKDGSNVSASFTLQVVVKTNSISILEPLTSRLQPMPDSEDGIRMYRLRAGTSVTLSAKPDDSKVTNKNAKWYVDDINGIPGINFRYNAALGYAVGQNFTITGLDVSERVCSVITAVADDAMGSFEMGTIPDGLYDQVGVCVFPSVRAVKIYRPTGSAGAGKDITGQTFYMDLGDTLSLGNDIGNIYAQNYPLLAYQGGWTWNTSNQSVLSYDGDSTFTANREGTVNLTARTLDGTNLTASIKVNVVDFDKLTEDQRSALLWSDDLYLGNSFAVQKMALSMAGVDRAAGVLAAEVKTVEDAAFAVTGPETAAPGENLSLIVSGVTEGNSVFWFSSDDAVASVDGTGTVSVAENAAVDSVVTITAAMDDENTTFATHEIKVAENVTGAEGNTGTSGENVEIVSTDELTAEAIENGDIDSLVALLLSEDSDESAAEIIEEIPAVESDENANQRDDQQVTAQVAEEPVNNDVSEITYDAEPTAEPVTDEQNETAQQTEAPVQPAGEEAVVMPTTTVDVDNGQQELPEAIVSVSESEPSVEEVSQTVTEEPQTVEEQTAPAVESIDVDVENDLIIVIYGQIFTLESRKLTILPAEADWNTLSFTFENEFIAELESEELAKIREEGLKIKGLAEGETILIIKSGEVEKKIRIIVQPVPAVETTPEVVENVESSVEAPGENQNEVSSTNDADQMTEELFDNSSKGTIEQENTGDDSVSSDVTETSVEQPAEEQVTDEPETESAAE